MDAKDLRLARNKHKDKLIQGAGTFDNQIFSMISNLDKNAVGSLAKPKHDTKRSDGRKVQTEKVSQKQTLQKADLTSKN